MESVPRQEALPRGVPSVTRAMRLLLEVEGPSSSEQDSPVSPGDSSFFLAGQGAPEGPGRRDPLLGVFSQEGRPTAGQEEAAVGWVALRSGGDDSRPAAHSDASPGSRNSQG